MSKKVTIAMSGGIDSTVAALLLLEKSYQVDAVTLNLFENDVKKAQEAAKLLGINHKVLDFSAYFEKDVMEAFKRAYENGETPNPCIVCNEQIKFGRLFFDKRISDGGYIATGHYAKIQRDDESGRYLLKKAKDLTKDQSYFLYRLSQDVLARTLFPLGDLTKDEIRALAVEKGLSDGEKSDSQDICFIKDGKYGEFLEDYMKVEPRPGNFIDKEGNVLGRHKGIIYYTPGQRRGLEISSNKRKYVLKIDAKYNTVLLGDEEDLYERGLTIGDVNLISIENLTKPIRAEVKTRYSHKGAEAIVSPKNKKEILINFKKGQRAISPGQSAVFYHGDLVVGGGIILK